MENTQDARHDMIERDCVYMSPQEYMDAGKDNRGSGSDWATTGLTVDECCHMGVYGWPKGLQEAMPIYERAIETWEMESERNAVTQYYDVCGGEVHMGRYLSGEIENMIEYEPMRVASVGRVVTLCVSSTVSGVVSAASYLKRGAAIVALAVALEESQHSVEIWLDRTITKSYTGKLYTAKVLLKGCNDSVDPEVLAYWLAHPSVLRVHGFAQESPGTPQSPIESLPEGTIYIDCVRSDADIPEPEKLIKDTLVKLGIVDED